MVVPLANTHVETEKTWDIAVCLTLANSNKHLRCKQTEHRKSLPDKAKSLCLESLSSAGVAEWLSRWPRDRTLRKRA